MTAFRAEWSFDWLSVTVPNGKDGTGRRRKAPADSPNPDEDNAGLAETRHAEELLTRFCVSQGLHRVRVGNGTDGFRGAIAYGTTPVATERKATVRTGHSTDMPSIEIPGGDGTCATLAPRALAQLGPLNASRFDVCLDCRADGLYPGLWEYVRAEYDRRPGKHKPYEVDIGEGKTIYWNRGEQRLKVYLKDYEQFAKGKLYGPPDPSRVRIEVTFLPHKVANKSGLAKLAAAEGAGALLGTAHWVRKMAAKIAHMLGACDEGAVLPITRFDRLPVVKTVEDKAKWVLSNGVRSLCAAAAARIVEKEFDGQWSKAEIEPSQVREGVVKLVGEYLDATNAPAKAIDRLALDEARDTEAQAKKDRKALLRWMNWDELERATAQDRLNAVYEVAADGEHRRLNSIRAAIRAEDEAYSRSQGIDASPVLRALDRAMKSRLSPATPGEGADARMRRERCSAL